MNQKPQRITVKIAVAIDRNGFWSAAGNCAYQTADEAMQAALDYLPQESAPPRNVVWVNAEVPLPVIEVVPGVVESVKTA
jgi:hypothetical protein